MIFTDIAIFVIHFLATLGLIAWPIMLPAKSKSGFILQSMLVLLMFSTITILALITLSRPL